MKAIKINEDIVVFNKTSIPKKVIRFVNTIGLEGVDDATLLLLGIRDVIYQDKTDLQKYDDLTNINDLWLIGNEYVVPVIDFTQEEINAKAQREEDSDISAIKELKYRSDGEEAYMKMKIYVKRQLDKGYITSTQFNNIYIPTKTALVWLNTGDWDIVQIKFNEISRPSTNPLQNIYDTIKLKIDTYVTDNY